MLTLHPAVAGALLGLGVVPAMSTEFSSGDSGIAPTILPSTPETDVRRRFTREFAELLGRGDLADDLETRYAAQLADTRTALGDVSGILVSTIAIPINAVGFYSDRPPPIFVAYV